MREIFGSLKKRIASRLYHSWYYDTQLFQKTTFLGVKSLKSVSDMWNYQEIIYNLKTTLVVEFGTNDGGSTLYFQAVLGAMSKRHRVFSVDIEHTRLHPSVRENANIELMVCSSTDQRVSDRIQKLREEFPGPAFFILDSDHAKAHVLGEMMLLRGVTRHGDYLIVEDSNINGHPVFPEYGPGPYEAIEEYFNQFPDDYHIDVGRENKFGFTFAVNGFLMRK